jgi:hypothetical protein
MGMFGGNRLWGERGDFSEGFHPSARDDGRTDDAHFNA